jgi:hypothetical protein
MTVRRVFGYVAFVAIIVAMAGLLGRGGLQATSYFGQSDTAVWYCAGEAVNEHADPYLVEPLRSCEIRNDPSHKYPWVEPAPLPGYALAGFALMARLPFPLARTLWFYLLIAAVIATAVMIAKLAKIPALLALLCLAMVDGYVNLSYAELPPLVLAALVASAALGASRRYVPAAIVAAVTMIEPHIGLPACLSMFVWWPRTRVPFIISGVLLGVLTIVALGVPVNLEYFHTLLPLQAASEIAAQDQYSLTRVLHLMNVSDRVALGAGTASYLAMTAIGVMIARRLAARVKSDALIALLPPALALLGGPFVHDLQLAAAIPAALILASSTQSTLLLRAFPLVAIGFPWHHWTIASLHGQAGALEIGAALAAILIATRTKTVATRITAGLAGVLALLILACAIKSIPEYKVGPPRVVTAAAIAPVDVSAANWAAFLSRDPSSTTPNARDVTEKVPVWLGLIALAWTSLALAQTKGRLDSSEPTESALFQPTLPARG